MTICICIDMQQVHHIKFIAKTVIKVIFDHIISASNSYSENRSDFRHNRIRTKTRYYLFRERLVNIKVYEQKKLNDNNLLFI